MVRQICSLNCRRVAFRNVYPAHPGPDFKPFLLLKSIIDGTSGLPDFEIKKVLRLHPPRQGWEAIKKSYATGGSLGYRGKEINALIEKMLPGTGGGA